MIFFWLESQDINLSKITIFCCLKSIFKYKIRFNKTLETIWLYRNNHSNLFKSMYLTICLPNYFFFFYLATLHKIIDLATPHKIWKEPHCRHQYQNVTATINGTVTTVCGLDWRKCYSKRKQYRTRETVCLFLNIDSLRGRAVVGTRWLSVISAAASFCPSISAGASLKPRRSEKPPRLPHFPNN